MPAPFYEKKVLAFLKSLKSLINKNLESLINWLTQMTQNGIILLATVLRTRGMAV